MFAEEVRKLPTLPAALVNSQVITFCTVIADEQTPESPGVALWACVPCVFSRRSRRVHPSRHVMHAVASTGGSSNASGSAAAITRRTPEVCSARRAPSDIISRSAVMKKQESDRAIPS